MFRIFLAAFVGCCLALQCSFATAVPSVSYGAMGDLTIWGTTAREVISITYTNTPGYAAGFTVHVYNQDTSTDWTWVSTGTTNSWGIATIIVHAGDGNDTVEFSNLYGNSWKNLLRDQGQYYGAKIYGEGGNDTLVGVPDAKNYIDCGAYSANIQATYAHTVTGGDWTDEIVGSSGPDYINAGGGDDHVNLWKNETPQPEYCDGGAGNDFIEATQYPGTGLQGGDGIQVAYGGTGEDTIKLGYGEDVVHVEGDCYQDIVIELEGSQGPLFTPSDEIHADKFLGALPGSALDIVFVDNWDDVYYDFICGYQNFNP